MVHARPKSVLVWLHVIAGLTLVNGMIFLICGYCSVGFDFTSRDVVIKSVSISSRCFLFWLLKMNLQFLICFTFYVNLMFVVCVDCFASLDFASVL